MKLVRNNRDEKILIVEEVLSKLNINLNSYKDQSKLVEEITYRILENKLKKRPENRMRYYEGSNLYKMLIETYERSLASVSLYFFKNNIKSTIGYVYLVSNPSYPNHIKIGYSQDAETRMSVYQVSSPFKDFNLERYVIVRDAYKLEQYILEKYKVFISNGEWLEFKDYNMLFTDICRSASELKMYNRFDRSLKEKFFKELEEDKNSPLKRNSIENLINNVYRKHDEDDPHIRDKNGKVLIRRHKISKSRGEITCLSNK